MIVVGIIATVVHLLLQCLPPAVQGQQQQCGCEFRREVLMELYAATNGVSWQQPWNLSQTVCTWKGVYCDFNDVTAIQLDNQRLSGTLPDALAALTELRFLGLANNSLEGSVPGSFAAWAKLNTLVLTSNALSGTLHASVGIHWPLMEYFDISNNLFVGTLPESTRGWASLSVFDVHNNQFSGSLPSSGDSSWPRLTYLSVYRNRLSGTLPASYASLGSAYSNRSSVVVVVVYAFHNALTGSLPPEWSVWGRIISVVSLFNNSLSGTLPDSYGNWTGIRQFDVSYNDISGTLPSAYASWTELRSFVVRVNRLTGTLPESYGAAWGNSLFECYVNMNQLNGTLPSVYSAWRTVVFFLANSNRLSGTLPSSWSSMASLESLLLQGNQLMGTLPVAYATMTRLTYFSVAVNQISGTLPAEWSSMRLFMLALQGNPQLAGPIPTSWSVMGATLKLCSICGTQLCGLASQLGIFAFACLPLEALNTEDIAVVMGLAEYSLGAPCPAPGASTPVPNVSPPSSLAPARSDATQTLVVVEKTEPFEPTLSAAERSAVALSGATSAVGVATTVGGGDPGDMQMLSSVLTSSCMCGSVRSASHNMGYVTSPFVDVGTAAVVFGNIGLSVAFLLLHLGVLRLATWYLSSNSRKDDAKTHKSSGSSSDDAAYRTRHPNYTIRMTLFLSAGVVKGSVAVFDRPETVDIGAATVGVCWIAVVFLVLELWVYRYHILGQPLRFVRYQNRAAFFHPMPPKVSEWLLPIGAWHAKSVRRCYGGIVASLTDASMRRWYAMPLLNVLTQVLSSLPVENDVGCTCLQGGVALASFGGAAYCLGQRPHRTLMVSLLTAASLFLVALVSLLGAMCRYDVVSSNGVFAVSTVASVVVIASRVYGLCLYFVEKYFVRRNNNNNNKALTRKSQRPPPPRLGTDDSSQDDRQKIGGIARNSNASLLSSLQRHRDDDRRQGSMHSIPSAQTRDAAAAAVAVSLRTIVETICNQRGNSGGRGPSPVDLL